MIKSALIFAAGFGTRMRPLTNLTPKPLLTIADRPVLYHALDMILLNLNITTIYINCHHLAEQVIQSVEQYPLPSNRKVQIHILYEEQILDTGGTVSLLAKKINDEAIITMNGDSLFSMENHTARLCNNFEPNSMDFLLMIQECNNTIGYDGPGEFDFGKGNQLIHHKNQSHQYMFSGLQILKPSVIAAHEEKIFSLKDIFYPATGMGKVYGIINPSMWYHASTPEDLQRINDIFAA